MLYVYGKIGCTKCIEIKELLDKKGIDYKYIESENLLMQKARALYALKRLKEQTVPIIIDEENNQITHKEIRGL